MTLSHDRNIFINQNSQKHRKYIQNNDVGQASFSIPRPQNDLDLIWLDIKYGCVEGVEDALVQLYTYTMIQGDECMKKNFTISIEESLIKSIKCCAVSNETTSSNLISEYIKAIKKTNGSIIRAIDDINKK